MLATLDRTLSNELVLTHKLVADMLGVSREGVMEAAKKLQQGGLIRKRRGRITVLDRYGLEDHACECHGVIKAEFDRLLGKNPDWMRMSGSTMPLPGVNADICVPA